MRSRFLPILAASLAPMTLAQTALAQSTAFTYQGELKSGGTPANGLFDLRFRVHQAPSGGSHFLPEVCANDVLVSDGRFVVNIDVPGAFAADAARYLEVFVRANTGLDCSNSSGYTTLSPRQAITSTPRANRANAATSLAPGDGSQSQSLLVSNGAVFSSGASVGDPPLKILTVPVGPTPGEGLRVQGTAPDAANQAYVSFTNTSGIATGYVGDGSSGDNTIFVGSYIGDVGLVTPGGRALTAQADGAIRIGAHSGDYRRLILGGGNSEGFLYGSFARLGDGIHMGYNYFADPAGNNQIIHQDGGTSRISTGYGTIALATAPAFGGAPIDRLVIDPAGKVTVPSSAGPLTVAAGEESLRIVRGVVNFNGAILSGSGFTVSHPSAGSYTVNFSTPFASNPSVTFTVDTSRNLSEYNYSLRGVSVSSATFRIRSSISGNMGDEPFHFIAVGPR